MTHKHDAELKSKCRRLIYDKISGKVCGVAAGGGALEELTGDALIYATISMVDGTDPVDRFACIEEYYNPSDQGKPLSVDLATVNRCHDAVSAHRTATAAEEDYIFRQSVLMTGTTTTPKEDRARLVRALKIRQIQPADTKAAPIQAELDRLTATCKKCCIEILESRDAVITYAPLSNPAA